ncbi:HupE/UreJ family protein [Candidatus Frankia nodulisporulans]|uniref:HupE/UreJ family protein n=1 Tax=Candidatus Frankia nodulisporulans TaxID=2060052 RepID=UPI0013D419CA|nr:HupE/UreJ family protein [Candidatus Frankia nodulisporulans]
MRDQLPRPGAGIALTGRRQVPAFLTGTVCMVCVVLGAVLAFTPGAWAHPLSTSVVRLDVGERTVTATVDLPLDQLGVAMDRRFTAADVLDAATVSALRAYVQGDLSATDSTGRTWVTRVAGGRVESIDGADDLVLDATLTPGSGPVGDFVLHYDAVVDRLVSHRVFVSARYGSTGPYTTVAMLSWQTQSVPVAALPSTSTASTSTASTTTTAAPASGSQGFVSAVHLGVEHISGGSDHLLFLLMLLLPAPLAAMGRRWASRPDLGRAGWRVLHVVTAFAVGHSITLALGAMGWVRLPARLVESGIALSVLVSAVHAVRPLVRRGEVLIAVTFGLLHGLAFAALLGALDLGRRSLLTTLLGFNLGIEMTQLVVVALVMPSLIVISRTVVYPVLRIAVALLGAVLAAAWFAQRSGLMSGNPLEPVGELLVEHPLILAAGLAVVAVLCELARRAGHLTGKPAAAVTRHEPEPVRRPVVGGGIRSADR